MKTPPISPIPAFAEVMGLLRLLSQPEECSRRLSEMEALRNEINAALQGKQRLERLDALEAQAQANASAAAERLAKAQEKADEITRLAEEGSTALSAGLDAAEAEFAAWKSDAEKKLAAQVEEAERVRRDASEARTAAQEAMAKAEDAARESRAVQDEYEAKLKQLRGLVA